MCSWHWIFLVNLPVGALRLLLVWRLLGRFETERCRPPIDAVDIGLLALGVGSPQILLDKGNELDWFGSPLIVALVVVATILVVFVVWTLTLRHPVVELRLFARRNDFVGVGCLVLASVAFFGTNVVVPLWLQIHMDYTAEWAGRTLAFGGLLAIVLGPVIGATIHRLDARAVATFGLTMTALAYVSNQVIGIQASLLATNAVLLVSAAPMLALIVVIWFAQPPFSAGGAAGH
ncbi:MAG: MFS transporter [Candidatus Competibacteraceae bacterium]|nr:MFS transporter [Candidatus Competibacteraceae bacterium]